MYVGIKLEIHPTKEQEEILFSFCKARHFIWNKLIEMDKESKLSVSKTGIVGIKAKMLREKYQLKIPERLIRGVIVDFAHAKIAFYNGISAYPKFHKFTKNKQSFRLEDTWHRIDLKNKTVVMPMAERGLHFKTPRIKFVENYMHNEVNNPAYKYVFGKWYLCGFIIKPTIEKIEKPIIGMDWGIKTFMTLSNGDKISYPKTILREYQRINKLRSILDKKKHGSNNWLKVRVKLNRAMHRFYNLKKDYIEQTTTKICREFSVSIEDLNMEKIMKDDKKNNKFMKNSRRLRFIQPYYLFVSTLEYKCEKYGSSFYKVKPARTSMICSNCGCAKIRSMNISERVYHCEACGIILDRDINAAKNIAALATCNS